MLSVDCFVIQECYEMKEFVSRTKNVNILSIQLHQSLQNVSVFGLLAKVKQLTIASVFIGNELNLVISNRTPYVLRFLGSLDNSKHLFMQYILYLISIVFVYVLRKTKARTKTIDVKDEFIIIENSTKSRIG